MILPVVPPPGLSRLENEADFCANCDDWMLLDFEKEDEQADTTEKQEQAQEPNRKNPGPPSTNLAEVSLERYLMSEAPKESIKKEEKHVDEDKSIQTSSTPTNNPTRCEVDDDSSTNQKDRKGTESGGKEKITVGHDNRDDKGHSNFQSVENLSRQIQSCERINTSDSDSSSCSTRSNNKRDLESNEEATSTRAVIPNKFDILCGQSRICANHTGNRRFQVVLDIYADTYQKANTKQEKMTLTKEIVACIASCGGRFLKYTSQEGLWEEISSVTARDKVSHALRTKVASIKRQREQQDQEKEEDAEEDEEDDDKASQRRYDQRSEEAPPLKRSSSESSKIEPNKRKRHGQSKPRRSLSSNLSKTLEAKDKSMSSTMDDLLRAQREIFASLTRQDPLRTSSRRTVASDTVGRASPPTKKQNGRKKDEKIKMETLGETPKRTSNFIAEEESNYLDGLTTLSPTVKANANNENEKKTRQGAGKVSTSMMCSRSQI